MQHHMEGHSTIAIANIHARLNCQELMNRKTYGDYTSNRFSYLQTDQSI